MNQTGSKEPSPPFGVKISLISFPTTLYPISFKRDGKKIRVEVSPNGQEIILLRSQGESSKELLRIPLSMPVKSFFANPEGSLLACMFEGSPTQFFCTRTGSPRYF